MNKDIIRIVLRVFCARQLVVDGLVANDEGLGKELLISAIKTGNDTIAKLMLAIHQDENDFIDMKTKPKDVIRIDNLIQSSIGYLNSSVQLILIAYSVLGEEHSLLATLANYQSFIEQTLLKPAIQKELLRGRLTMYIKV